MKNGKLKKVLTSRITIGIVCFLLGGIVFGGQSKQPTEQANTSSQTQEQTSKEDSSKSDSKSDKKSQSKSDLEEIKLGEAFTVKKSTGEYNVTIEGIRFTDDRNQFSEKQAQHVFFLDFNYENVSCSDEVYLFESNFKVMDEQGNVLDTYPVSDDTRRSKQLPIGAKCNATGTYAMTTTSKTLKVLFYDNMYGKPLGQVIIETGLQ